MRLSKLTLENFRSVTSPLSLDFDESGLVSLEAINRDSGGSSGAGKSTVALSIAYALGFCDISANALANRENPKGMGVTLELEHEGTSVTIHRGKSQWIKVGDQTSTGATAVTDGIRQLFGVGPDTIKALTYRQQKKPGLFLSMDDSSKKEFLGEILGLGAYEKALEATKSAVTSANSELATAAQAADNLENTLQSMPTLVDPVAPDRTAFATRAVPLNRELALANEGLQATKERLETLRSTLDESKSADAQIVALKASIVALRASLNEQVTYTVDHSALNALSQALITANDDLAKWESYDRAENQKVADQVRQMRQQLAPLQQAKGMAVGLAKQVMQLKAERAKLEQSMCPTCDRQWDEAQGKLVAIDQQIASHESQIRDHLESHKKAAPLEEEINRLSAQKFVSPQTTEAARAVSEAKEKVSQEKYRLQSEQALFDQRHTAHKNKLRADISAAELGISQREQDIGQNFHTQIEEQVVLVSDFRSKVAKAESELSMLRNEYENAKKSYEQQKSQYDKYVDTMQGLNTKVRDARAKVAAADATQKLEEDSLNTIRTFLTHILDEVLQEIAQEANSILARMPNVQHLTVGFKTEAVTQKGVAKSKIVPFVVVDGQELQLASGVLSGGQETSLELAVDLALAGVVERRTGAQPKWMVLDEAFDGLDGVTKEHCLEILKTYASDRLVIVISHVPEFQEVFDGKITLTMKDGVTTLSGE